MQDGALCERKVKNYQTRKKAFNYKDLRLFLTPSALSAAVSEYHAVADGHDPPDCGHDGSHFGRPLDGSHAPGAAIGTRMRTDLFGSVGPGFWHEIQDFCTHMEEPRKQGKRPLFDPLRRGGRGGRTSSITAVTAPPSLTRGLAGLRCYWPRSTSYFTAWKIADTQTHTRYRRRKTLNGFNPQILSQVAIRHGIDALSSQL